MALAMCARVWHLYMLMFLLFPLCVIGFMPPRAIAHRLQFPSGKLQIVPAITTRWTYKSRGMALPETAVPTHMTEPITTAATANPGTVPSGETFEFQADVSKVMDIIINSLYSNKDVFLREVISNAADACDKRRFVALQNPDTPLVDELSIKVVVDKQNNTLIVEDNGVGMSKEELQNNLGRIAQSGTKRFIEAAGSNQGDLSLIGQFGVGFYSGYLVADRLTVISKSHRPNSPQLRWESKAGSTYTISEDHSAPISGSGTRVLFHLKEDSLEYLDTDHLGRLLRKYSEFVQTPIHLQRHVAKLVQEADPDAKPDANGT